MEEKSINLKLKGVISIKSTLVNLTGLLIGSGGGKLEIGEMDIEPLFTYYKYKIKYADQKSKEEEREIEVPIIPGSSLKGRMRSLLELVLNVPLYSDGKIVQHFGVSSYEEFKNMSKCLDPKCPICSFFGRPSVQIGNYISRLHQDTEIDPLLIDKLEKQLKDFQKLTAPTRMIVRDAVPSVDYINKLASEKAGYDIGRDDFLEIKPENRIDRVTSAADPRTFARIKPYVEFDSEIIFNIYFDFDLDNFKKIVSGLSLLEKSYLGAAGSRGYGKIKFKNIKMTLIPVKSILGEEEIKKVFEFDDVDSLLSKIDEIIEVARKMFFSE